MVGPAAQRAGAAHLKAVMGLSERRACSIVGADRTMVRYRSRRPPDNELRARLRELANERRRFQSHSVAALAQPTDRTVAHVIRTGNVG
jgi:putative transposase